MTTQKGHSGTEQKSGVRGYLPKHFRGLMSNVRGKTVSWIPFTLALALMVACGTAATPTSAPVATKPAPTVVAPTAPPVVASTPIPTATVRPPTVMPVPPTATSVPPTAIALPPTSPLYVIKILTDKKVSALPAGPLFVRLENYPTLAAAQAAVGPMGLAAESGGKAWLFTFGPAGGSSPGGTKVAEVGPLPQVAATEYMLRINEASGPPGAKTSVHTHPGPEAFYVLTGELSIRTPQGMVSVAAGKSEVGVASGTPLEVSISGSTDLIALVMFVVDATKTFSSPATFP